MHITVYTYPHITGGQTGKKKATAYLQSLNSTVHANILALSFRLLFTHFLPLFSPSFHPVFTPFLSFSIAFAPNNLIDRRCIITLHHFFGELRPQPVSLTISSYVFPLIYTASSASYLYPSPAASASSLSDARACLRCSNRMTVSARHSLTDCRNALSADMLYLLMFGT